VTTARPIGNEALGSSSTRNHSGGLEALTKPLRQKVVPLPSTARVAALLLSVLEAVIGLLSARLPPLGVVALASLE
jgi:hypothetical protein